MIKLFEKGLNPVEVATITEQNDTRMLTHYTHLRAFDPDQSAPFGCGTFFSTRPNSKLESPFRAPK
jgi:hypothetical protein